MASTGTVPPTSEFQADRSLQTLASRAAAWAALPLGRRIDHLRTLLHRTGEVGPDLVAAAVAAKGNDRHLAGEDWVGAVSIQARTIRALLATLEGIRRTGRVPVSADRVSTRAGGQVVLGAVPMDAWDRLLFPGWRGDVWLDPEVGVDDLDDDLGSFYTKGGTARPGVAVVLGAGNVACIPSTDAIDKLFVEGKTVVVKFNPVNDYIGPFFEYVFGELIDEGFVRTAYGGPGVGEYLAFHPSVDEVHVTGSTATHDAIVFGEGAEGERRRAAREPRLDKRITSELGNVSPLIVVPGEWSRREMAAQASQAATQIKQNDGFNCNAAKVIVLHRGWPQREEFLDRLRDVLGSVPPRPAYYPGAESRWQQFVDSHPSVELVGPAGSGILPAALAVGLDPAEDHPAFREESFCAAAAVTDLGGSDAAEFLHRAVGFANERLFGTLNATLLVDPRTAASLGASLEEAIAALRYGSIGVNEWAAASYALGILPWGGFPGRPLHDVQSGTGFVHNGLLVDRPQKTVTWAPFVKVPEQPWMVTHGNPSRALRRFAEFEVSPGIGRLLALGAEVVRG